SAGYVLKRHGWRALDEGSALFDGFAPPVRASVIVLYFFVVFHKLNRDFFDPDISCAAEMFFWLRERLSFLPGGRWVGQLNLYATLVIEAAIPVLLIV